MTEPPHSDSDASRPLRALILEALQRTPGLTGSEIAAALGMERGEVNRCLSQELVGQVRQGNDYRWRLGPPGRGEGSPAPAAGSDISRLCRYYLDCISYDLNEGASAVAQSRDGSPSYVELASVPTEQATAWWNSPGVGRLVGKVREDHGKLMLWLGYPVRLRRHQTASWKGFFVEPVLLWPVLIPARNGDAPSIDRRMPMLNAKFLRSMAVGGGRQVAQESAALTDELGLSVPATDLPEMDELIERLVRIRPDWDWQEPIDPSACTTTPPLARISTAGIYNRAVVIPGERSRYTLGLEAELTGLSKLSDAQLRGTALGRWLAGGVPPAEANTPDPGPLIEVVPMNTEQRAAVRSALSAAHTVVTGPPGTGKSQVVTTVLVNAAWRGMKVLFASKNNKAVDVVEARVNELATRPVLMRLGADEYQAKLEEHLTQVLSGMPSAEMLSAYDEALERHRSLATQLAELDRVQQATLDRRNTVDRLDAEAEEGRQILGAAYAELTPAVRDRAAADVLRLDGAVDAVDRDRQGLLVRLLWGAINARRARRLAEAVRQAAGTFEALGARWQPAAEPQDVAGLRARLADLGRRVKLAYKVIAYKEALRALQESPSFESIARRRAELTGEMSRNSVRLWEAWVALTPARLTPAQRKHAADFAAALPLLTSRGAGEVHPSVKRKARELQAQVTSLFSCWAVTSLSARGRIPLEPGFFDLVVIDEASQCDIASALPLLYRAKRSVVIGDPMQLRHISALTWARDSELQHAHGLVDTRLGWMYAVKSLFDLGASVVPSANIINLRDHHRSHADIIGFSNEEFYEGRLRVATRYAHLNRPDGGQPGIVWQDVNGAVTRPREGGAQNDKEARAIVEALADLLVTRGYHGTVGVVTPFRAQAQLLQSLIQARPELLEVRDRAELLVDTVHKFQGDERDVIFFSPVVASGISSGALSFLRNNGNLFNVAITRARGLLHVVGDRTAAASCGVNYLEDFVEYVSALDTAQDPLDDRMQAVVSPDYPPVMHPERVSDWERELYRAMVSAGLGPIPQFSVDQYDLDFALIEGDRKLAIEVDGERYHRSWTGELCLRDQLRNQRLIELGWEVQRFWVYEVRDELQACVRRVQAWRDEVRSQP